MTRFTPLIEALPVTIPFVGPEALARQTGKPILARMGANENVFGPSPAVIAALQNNAAQVWQYGDPEVFDLKLALARHLAVEPENIAVGEGIDGLHGLAVRLFVETGTRVVTSLGAYPTFAAHVASFGGDLIRVAYRDDFEDLAGLVTAARSQAAKILYIANPDNPMGTWWPAADIQRVMDDIPEATMLMLDEAYFEFAPEGTAPQLDVSRKNILRFRTFSKAYGMAGLRVGYALGHADVIAAFDKVRNHFGVTKLSQMAAVAALEDQDWVGHVVANVAVARMRIGEIARVNGLLPITSATNFVAVDCGRDAAYTKAIVDGLLRHGIFIRMPGVAPLSRCIRISAGTKENLDLLAEVLPSVLKSVANI